MTLVKRGMDEMISMFGESVTVKPQASQEPVDSNNPVFFEEQTSNNSDFTEKVRLYTAPAEEMLKEYGFEDDTEAIIYNNNDSINVSDVVEYNNYTWVVKDRRTNQIGDGPYIYIYSLLSQ